MKLPAGSMVYALLLALLMGLVAGSLVLFHQLYLTEVKHWQTMDRLVLNSQSGINWLLASPAESNDEPAVVDLFGEGRDSVLLNRKNWGIFEMVQSTAYFKGQQHSRQALIGNFAGKEEPTLYLSDRNKALALCGKTLIKGKTLLPKAGVKRAYIEGQTFVGNKLVEGSIGQSQRGLPPFNQELADGLLQDVRANWKKTDSVGAWEALETTQYHFPWASHRAVLTSSNPINLGNVALSGQLVLYSEQAIHISSSARLTDLILIAPEITVDKGFQGTAQLLATKSLFIDEDVQLNYPSVAALFTLEKPVKTPLLQLSKNSTLEGVVFSYRTFNTIKNKPRIQLDQESLVMGQIYCQGVADVKGKVHGSFYGESFYLATPSATYENHLLNVTLDLSMRPNHFIGMDLPEVSNKKGIVKWLRG